MHLVSFRKQLGDALVEAGIITKEQLAEALNVQKQSGGNLSAIFSRMGIINEEVLLAFLGKQCGVPYVSLKEYGTITESALSSVPESLIRRQMILPIEKEGNTLTIAMADPFNIFAVDDIKLMTGHDVRVVISSELEIKTAIDKYFIRNTLKESSPDASSDNENRQLNSILYAALSQNASEIHFEPHQGSLRVRFKIGGVLCEKISLPEEQHNKIIRALKLISEINPAEQRLPQNGFTKIDSSAGQTVDARVSVIPTIFGERALVHILNPASATRDISKLGFEPDQLAIYKRKIESTGGLILVTGPVGSGKTTTIYATLSALNFPDKNILTIEHPVEYVLPGITQIQLHQSSGLSYTSIFEASLRQNPEVIFVGELPDQKTARLAMSAALNGHLVFSTITASDALEALIHLAAMGLEPFLVSCSLSMVAAQRMVRTICPSCKSSYTLSSESIQGLGVSIPGDKDNITLYRGKGCELCAGTGYNGSTGIFEILDIDETMRKLLFERAAETTILDAAKSKGFRTLRESCWQKVHSGISTIEEMIRRT